MTQSPIAPNWVRREPPLEIAGALATGDAAARMLRRLASTQIDPLLRVSTNDGWLLVIGPEPALPWVDNVTWLGRDGPIFTPTNYTSDMPTDLLARALSRAAGIDGLHVVTASGSFVSPIPHSAPDQQVLAELANAFIDRAPPT